MQLLIIGSGGREHALAWKFSQNEKVTKIFTAPGNAGTAMLDKGENIALTKVDELLSFAQQQKIDLTIVGSEALLVEGIVDSFEAAGLRIFGPDRRAAMLEGSKAFSKDFMKKYGVKTAAYEIFSTPQQALEYLHTASFPIVVKASGLAAGKGVIICQDLSEAEKAVKDIMQHRQFGDAGEKIVIEEYLEGVEASILSITDSKTILTFISAKDHKKIGEGETGLNTGGMGVIAPNPFVDEKVMKLFGEDILTPSLHGIQKEGMKFNGFIFFGLMITKRGVYLLEYNMRLGDPETQAILPLLEDDLLDILLRTMEGDLGNIELHWKKAYSCCVVAASEGYPLSYEKGKTIEGLDNVDVPVFLAGVQSKEGSLLTSGGRVLNVTGTGESLERARQNAYRNIRNIHFDGMYYRKDI